MSIILEVIKPAAKHMFAALDEYDNLSLPNIHDYVGQDGVVRMSEEEHKKYMEQIGNFMDHERARSIVAGSILQVAYKSIKIHSKNETVSPTCKEMGVDDVRKAIPFCIGRKVHEVPIGLIIYAGRIQYNHWEEGEPWNPVAKNVLRELFRAHLNNPLFDLAYDLEYPSPKPVSHYIVRLELEWHSYSDFENDLRDLLQ